MPQPATGRSPRSLLFAPDSCLLFTSVPFPAEGVGINSPRNGAGPKVTLEPAPGSSFYEVTSLLPRSCAAVSPQEPRSRHLFLCSQQRGSHRRAPGCRHSGATKGTGREHLGWTDLTLVLAISCFKRPPAGTGGESASANIGLVLCVPAGRTQGQRKEAKRGRLCMRNAGGRGGWLVSVLPLGHSLPLPWGLCCSSRCPDPSRTFLNGSSIFRGRTVRPGGLVWTGGRL